MSCVIVLGCYRSGTSAVAGVLHRLGVSMGKEFDKPSIANPTGYYEDLEFKRLYAQLAEGKEVEGSLDVLARMRDTEYPIWGVKDPQLCILLHRFLPLLKTDHRIISTIRDKHKICDSLSKAMKSKFSDTVPSFLPLVEKYLTSKEEMLANYNGPVLEIDFELLKIDARKEVERIAEFVNLPVNQDAIDFIKGD